VLPTPRPVESTRRQCRGALHFRRRLSPWLSAEQITVQIGIGGLRVRARIIPPKPAHASRQAIWCTGFKHSTSGTPNPYLRGEPPVWSSFPVSSRRSDVACPSRPQRGTPLPERGCAGFEDALGSPGVQERTRPTILSPTELRRVALPTDIT
jgi:hypothetical protein